jgi:DNA/RNA-binding domain of Phe-tRNA-synthetase-like protein
MELRQVQLSDSLEGLARIGVVFLSEVANGPVSSSLRRRMDALAEELRRTVGDRRLSQIESVQRSRNLYRSLGLDPTKDRPSSERLLRRVLRKRPLPKINKLVDATHLASLSLQCPLSVYDWDKIVPPVLVRIGRPEDTYLGPSGKKVSLEGRLVLVDGEGLFGNPSQDSQRTLVSLGTVRAFVTAWAPADASSGYLESVLKEVVDLSGEFCGASASAWGILC